MKRIDRSGIEHVLNRIIVFGERTELTPREDSMAALAIAFGRQLLETIDAINNDILPAVEQMQAEAERGY